jgi:hypothetical protein
MTKVGRIPCATFVGSFWFPSSRLGTPWQAKLLLCEKIIYYCAMRPQQELGGNLRSQAGAWERGKGGMRCAFPPYRLQATHEKARRAGLSVRRGHKLMERRTTENFEP